MFSVEVAGPNALLGTGTVPLVEVLVSVEVASVVWPGSEAVVGWFGISQPAAPSVC